MFNFTKWPVGDLEDLISSLSINMVDFNIDIDIARRIRKELEYKYNRDKYHKYAYCYLCYRTKKYDYVDLYKIKNLLVELVNEGYIPAYNLLGNAYYYGWGVERSYTKALQYYEYAHKKGYLISTFNLALHKFSNKELSAGRELIEVCINGEYASGYYVKGYGYQFGKYGYPVDKARALSLYEIGANKSETKCSYFAGSMYMSGIGCTVNHTKALKYLEKAAMFDEVEAKYLTAIYYFEGKHVDRFYERALSYFEEAAELGHVRSKAYVGLCYLNGYGCFPDRDKAERLIREAANNNDELGKMLLDKLY